MKLNRNQKAALAFYYYYNEVMYDKHFNKGAETINNDELIIEAKLMSKYDGINEGIKNTLEILGINIEDILK